MALMTNVNVFIHIIVLKNYSIFYSIFSVLIYVKLQNNL